MRTLRVPAMVFALAAANACGSEEESITLPTERITTVEGYLVALCDLASTCPDISATPEDIEDCPSGILADFDADGDWRRVEQFIGYSKSEQDCVLACVEGLICNRFGVGLASMSGADATEPLVECGWSCQ